jgi:hypothetical protein
MNIFITSCNPYIAASHLDDLRLNKMILETAQILSTVIRSHGGYIVDQYNNILYKSTHANHPCTVWARKKIDNFNWLLKYFNALHDEYLARSNTEKPHLSYDKLNNIFLEYMYLNQQPFETDNNKIIFDFDCTNVEVQTLFLDEGIHGKYKECMINKWRTDKKQPRWWKSSDIDDVPLFAKSYLVEQTWTNEKMKGL